MIYLVSGSDQDNVVETQELLFLFKIEDREVLWTEQRNLKGKLPIIKSHLAGVWCYNAHYDAI